VVLGAVGTNFGAGMTGGMAFVYDPDGSFERRANPENITWNRLASSHWESVLLGHVRAHHAATDSKWSGALLDDWGQVIDHFWQVVPKEMLSRLAQPLDDRESLQAAE
jgi:glutamate synthase (NADPH/NADH) large chain